MQLSTHFTLAEFVVSQEAARRSINNTPPPSVVEMLRHTAQRLEDVRALLGAPIIISSGFRCLSLNRAIGSRDTSQHVLGQAVDFTCPRFGDARGVAIRIRDHAAEIDYDQMIWEYGAWVHISFVSGTSGRRQALTIDARTPNGRLFA